MKKLIILTDFTESFSYKLLMGIMRYSKGREPWIVCKMPPSFMTERGFEGVLDWAKGWNADAIIGRFSNAYPVEKFAQAGIIAVAQDYKEPFETIPNITADYLTTGQMAADFFLSKGFNNFAYYGYEDAFWSRARGKGFYDRLSEKKGTTFSSLEKVPLEDSWRNDNFPIVEWLRTLPLPVAIFACDDTQAQKLQEVCELAGIRVPADAAILGVDDDELTCNLSHPTISSISVTIEQAGYQTAEMIDGLLTGAETKAHDIVIKPLAVVNRMSTDIYATRNVYVRNALEYIYSNYTQKLTVDMILERIPMSRRRLENLFRQEVGMGVYEYICRIRVEKLAQRLIVSDESIGALAISLGFSDPKNLSRLFKTMKGCTPEEYRRRKSL